MSALLDNPIWNAAITGNKSIAAGTENAKFLDRQMALFSALPAYTESNFNELHGLTPPDTLIAMFTDGIIPIPANWTTIMEKPILQMVYDLPPPAPEDIQNLVPLTDRDIPAMTALTTLTKPGPWLPRTIDFGNFEGIYVDGQLAAMCGQRLQPDPYSEVSGVCVHPGHLGKGYAKILIRNQLRKIAAAGRIPMLHLYSDNVSACRLYESIGFSTRKEMMVYMLKKK